MSATQLAQDWKPPLSATNFTGYLPEPHDTDPAGTVLRCITLSKIPCNREVQESARINRISLGIVKIVKRGWGAAPYKKPKSTISKGVPNKSLSSKEMKDPTKPLFEECVYQGHEAMKVYNYMKANNNTDKGVRADENFSIIQAGQTMTFSTKSEYFFKDKMMPENVQVIEPFTLVDIVVSPGSIETAIGDKGGYALKLTRVRLHDSSVYSYIKELSTFFESSIQAAQAKVIQFISQKVDFPGAISASEDNTLGILSLIPGEGIRNILDNKMPMLYIANTQVGNTAFVSDIRPGMEYWKVSMRDANEEVCTSIQAIDIPIAHTMRLLNTNDELYAKTLLDFALSARAVSFVAVQNEWYIKEDAAHRFFFFNIF